MCAMEMVAWLAGESHSDEPRCACPVIAAFVRAFNDALPSDSARGRYLRPWVPRMVNSRSGQAHEQARGWLGVDAVARALVPMALAHVSRRGEAELMQALPVVRSVHSAKAALRAIETYARDQHAARWVLQRAIDGVPPAKFIAGVVQVARMVGDATAFTLLAELVGAMLAVSPAAAENQLN